MSHPCYDESLRKSLLDVWWSFWTVKRMIKLPRVRRTGICPTYFVCNHQSCMVSKKIWNKSFFKTGFRAIDFENFRTRLDQIRKWKILEIQPSRWYHASYFPLGACQASKKDGLVLGNVWSWPWANDFNLVDQWNIPWEVK